MKELIYEFALVFAVFAASPMALTAALLVHNRQKRHNKRLDRLERRIRKVL